MFLLSILALLLLGVALTLLARGVLIDRVRTAGQLSTIDAYGFDGTPIAPAATSASAPAFVDLAAGLGAWFGRMFGRLHPEAARKDLMAAGLYRLSPNALLGYRVMLAGLFLLVGLLMLGQMPIGAGILFGSVTTAIAWMLPIVLVRRRARFRLTAIDRELPELIDLLVVTVEAGMGLGSSLQMASSKIRGPLADELRLTLQEQRMGRSISEALMRMLDRVNTKNMRSFVRSVVQGETLGVSIGTIMRNLSLEMRKRRRQSAEERAQKAPTKMLFPLVFLILPAFMLVALGPALFTLMNAFN